MWNAEAMLDSAGSIISMASGFRAMIEAITTTNSGKPIGRWLDETQAPALISVTLARGAGGCAPKGQRNGNYKHGAATKEAVSLMRDLNMLAKMLKRLPR